MFDSFNCGNCFSIENKEITNTEEQVPCEFDFTEDKKS